MQSKTKPKTTKPKEDDKEQSARFIATARELGVDDNSETLFNQMLKKIIVSDKSKTKD